MKAGFTSATGYWCDSAPVHISLACITSETHNLQRVFRPSWGGGVVPYIGYIGMYRAKGYVFCSRSGLKKGFNFDHFGLK